MILWRLLPWRPDVPSTSPGGPLWFPRELQGAGRHDNPDLYGCLYASENPLSTVGEALVSFRGAGTLTEGMLVRAGVPLALARIVLADDHQIVDLDDPRVLSDTALRPSRIATHQRLITQDYAARLYEELPTSAGLRWWSAIEATLLNLTLFDRAQPQLEVAEVTRLSLTDAVVREAADLLGLV